MAPLAETMIVPRLWTLLVLLLQIQRSSWALSLLGRSDDVRRPTSRREWIAFTASALMMPYCQPALAQDTPSFVQEYEDFIKTDAGWSYRDVNPGQGTAAKLGDRVVYDWSGYTIGYFGRPFQAKGGPQGGAFDKDVDYERTVLGSHKLVAGVEQALVGMKTGGVRQVVVPFGDLSYPLTDLNHDVVGPKPTTFSGQRALNFVLENPRVDRTLLFNVKIIRIDTPNDSGGFSRGS